MAKRKSIKLADIAGQKFIAFEPDIPTRKAIDKILKEHNVTVQNVMEFDNIETVKRAVEIDAGISIVPKAHHRSGSWLRRTLAAVEFQDGEFLRPSAAIYKKNKVLSPAMKQFLAILKGVDVWRLFLGDIFSDAKAGVETRCGGWSRRWMSCAVRHVAPIGGPSSKWHGRNGKHVVSQQQLPGPATNFQPEPCVVRFRYGTAVGAEDRSKSSIKFLSLSLRSE